MTSFSKSLGLVALVAACGLTVACNRQQSGNQPSTSGTSPSSGATPSPGSSGASGSSGMSGSGSGATGDSYGAQGSPGSTGSSGSSGSSTSAIGDTAVTAKVKAALLADSDLKSIGITVDTTDGVVTLAGAVNNQAQIDRAAQVASAVNGVKRVQNTLSIKR